MCVYAYNETVVHSRRILPAIHRSMAEKDENCIKREGDDFEGETM